MWTAVWSIVGARLLYVVTNMLRVQQHHRGRHGQPRRPGRLRRHDRRLPGQLVRLPQAQDPAAAVGRRRGAVGGAGHGDHAHGLLPVRLRLRRALAACPGRCSFPGPNAAGAPRAARPGSTTCTTSGCRTTRPGRSRCTRRRSTRRWSGCSCSALLMLIRRYRQFSGQVFLGWVLGYGILRPLIEIAAGRRSARQRRPAVDLAVHRHRRRWCWGWGCWSRSLRRYRRDPEGLRLWLKRPQPATAPAVTRRAAATAAANVASDADARRRRWAVAGAGVLSSAGVRAQTALGRAQAPRPRRPGAGAGQAGCAAAPGADARRRRRRPRPKRRRPPRSRRRRSWRRR